MEKLRKRRTHASSAGWVALVLVLCDVTVTSHVALHKYVQLVEKKKVHRDMWVQRAESCPFKIHLVKP